MEITIGKTIKDLRKRDNRTQDDLAKALGVTCQAISRWESNGGYPDMELVPAIANYFHVSIDELFGYHGDREAQIQAIVSKAKAALYALGGYLSQDNRDITDTVDMLRAALEEFPNEPELMLLFADCLFYHGWQKNGVNVNPKTKENDSYEYDDIERNAQNVYWQEALQVFEKLLSLDASPKYREYSLVTMINICKFTGQYDKAKALANEQPSINLSKDVLLPLSAVGEEEARYHGELILSLLRHLYGAVSRSVLTNSDLSSSESGREALLAVIRLYETVLSDDRCGREHWDLRYLYLILARLEACHGNGHSKALTYFEKGFYHHKEYCRILAEGDYNYTAPLVAKVSLQKGQFQENPENFWGLTMPQYSDEFKEELKKNEKFKECFE